MQQQAYKVFDSINSFESCPSALFVIYIGGLAVERQHIIVTDNEPLKFFISLNAPFVVYKIFEHLLYILYIENKKMK